jgi:hypothetical protein
MQPDTASDYLLLGNKIYRELSCYVTTVSQSLQQGITGGYQIDNIGDSETERPVDKLRIILFCAVAGFRSFLQTMQPSNR